MVECKGRKCLKEINPDEHPGVFAGGEPWVYDENWGSCVDCQRQFEAEEIRKLEEKTIKLEEKVMDLKKEYNDALQQESGSELLEGQGWSSGKF